MKKLNNKLPSSWKEVTLEEWTEIAKIDKEQGAIHYNSEVISILTDIDVDELDIEELQELVDSCKWSTSEPSKNYKHEVEGMRLKAFNKLTLYEYIDLDYFCIQGYLINLPYILAILYRQTKENEWGEVVWEPYEYDCKERAEKLLDVPITDVYGVIKDFLKFREQFLNTYINLFEDPLPPEPEEGYDDEDDEPDTEPEKNTAKWSWELLIYNLCNGDLSKSDAIGGLPLYYVFNMLGMKKELDI